jgi:hypothetical protein
MAKKDEIALMAHFMRRAGFSANRDEPRGARCEELCGGRRGIAPSRDAAARRSLHLPPAPRRRTADGQCLAHKRPLSLTLATLSGKRYY